MSEMFVSAEMKSRFVVEPVPLNSLYVRLPWILKVYASDWLHSPAGSQIVKFQLYTPTERGVDVFCGSRVYEVFVSVNVFEEFQ